MKTNLTLLLSLVAVALAVASLIPHGAPRPAAAAVASPARLSPAPMVSESGGSGCVAAKATSLRALMRTGINPTMTSLSFALYHDPKANRLEQAATHSLALMHCIRVAATLHTDIALEGLPEYFRFLNNLQENTLAVNVAVMEGDDDGARHWFRHLKQDCVACHSRFRIDSGAEAQNSK